MACSDICNLSGIWQSRLNDIKHLRTGLSESSEYFFHVKFITE